jgi:hypothetical protein
MRLQVTDDVEVTALLRAWAAGQPGAADRLVPIVYQQLRRRAAAYLRGERRNHTLQPTALVHEAYLRLVGPADDLIETADDLLLGAGEAITDAAKKAHGELVLSASAL